MTLTIRTAMSLMALGVAASAAAQGSARPGVPVQTAGHGKPGTPVMTWSPYFGNHVADATVCEAGTCVRSTAFARFTLPVDVTIVRLQFHSDTQPIGILPFLGAACSGTVDVAVTDGVDTIAVAVPTGQANARDGDSGATAAAFAAGSALTAIYRHTFRGSGPDDFAAENCFYQAGGLTVQYQVP